MNDNIISTINAWLRAEHTINYGYRWQADDVGSTATMNMQADFYPSTVLYEKFKADTGATITKTMFSRILALHGYRLVSRRFADSLGNSYIAKAYRHVGTHKKQCLTCGGLGVVEGV